MKPVISILLLLSFCLSVYGFGTFGVGVGGMGAFVTEGDSVTLNTGVKTIQQEKIIWYFLYNQIAEITGDQSKICTDDQCKDDERLREKLKLNNKTGSLTITNITNTNAGVYKLEIITGSSSSDKIFIVTVRPLVFLSAAARDEMKRRSVKEGESVTLRIDVIKQPNDLMMWHFNHILIAEITGDQSKICTDDQCEERFRDRLKLDHQTGSLTITNIRTEDTGFYRLMITSSNSRVSIIRSFTIVTGTSGVNTGGVSVTEGDSVTLNTGVETKQQEKIIWYFNSFQIAEITGDLSFTCTDVQCNEGTERFRDRLKLDHQTGSVTITNITNTDSGDYQLLIQSSSSDFSEKIFSVSLHDFLDVGVSVSVMEEDSVTLHTNVTTNKKDKIRWYFNGTVIAEITGDQNQICTDVQCNEGTERFRDRLKLDHQTGSLTITNTDSGDYTLEIINISNSYNILKTFIVVVRGVSAAALDEMKRKSVMEGESVTLDTCVEINTNHLMTWYFNDIHITEITGDQSKICTDDQCKERFRDRLKANNQTGSLTITNNRTEDSGDYQLKISSRSRFSIIRSFTVTVTDPGLSPTAIGGIFAVILLVAAAAAVIYHVCQARRNEGRYQDEVQ